MKKYILSLAFLCSLTGFAQETEEITLKQNEIKLNGLYLVLGAFEATYERLLNDESAAGVSLFVPFDADINEEVNYYISPYYRFYFGNEYAKGFFLEGFGMLNSTNEYVYDFGSENSDKNSVTDFALGIGLGGKWLTKRGLLGEINFGIGRNLFNGSNSDNEFIGKLGITVGYRF
ncbi:MAG: DUF3575 domain-containing protein [Aureibaculum sp.]